MQQKCASCAILNLVLCNLIITLDNYTDFFVIALIAD